MISATLAKELKDAGLKWEPCIGDRFLIPDRDLDDRVFVLSDQLTSLQLLGGDMVVSFHGSLEWALDYLITAEVVWLPSEGQLREILLTMISQGTAGRGSTDKPRQPPSGSTGTLTLHSLPGSYQCEMIFGGELRTFEAASAPDAYGIALLALLNLRPS